VGEDLSWRIDSAHDGERLDRCVAEHLARPRNQVRQWIVEGRVTVNGRPAKPATAVRAGDALECRPPERRAAPGLEAEAGELAVLHEDPDLVVIDKPAGVTVHPGAGRARGTLVHFLLHRFPEIGAVGGAGRPGIVHRLDKDTTGALVVARTEAAYAALSAAFAERRVDKTYLAVVYGAPAAGSGRIDLPIGRHRQDRKRMQTRPDGRPATTRYRCLETAGGVSRLELDLETGRTHQIRVHLKAAGHPLVGDPTYGEARWKGLPGAVRRPLQTFPRPALHAWRLAFDHPRTGDRVAVEAPVPDDLRRLWRQVAGRDWM
jgi:23S rRNA pseudouridine1911/1915/1917 synthase